MTQSEAWMLQVHSDLAAGNALFEEDIASTYCQSIAKYQQVAEKSIRAMIAAVNESGAASISIGTQHYPEKQIDALLLLKKGVNSELIGHIHIILSGYRLGEIRAICLLAPKMPPRRNTEYPFPDGYGEWTAPAAEGSFLREDVHRFRRLVDGLVPMIGRFVQAARRSL